MTTRWFWPGIALTLGAALGIAIATGAGSPWRPILALGFVLICPGASLISVLGLRSRLAELAVVAPLSLSLVVLTSCGLFYGHVWSPAAEAGLLGGLCLAGLMWSIARPPRHVRRQT